MQLKVLELLSKKLGADLTMFSLNYDYNKADYDRDRAREKSFYQKSVREIMYGQYLILNPKVVRIPMNACFDLVENRGKKVL